MKRKINLHDNEFEPTDDELRGLMRSANHDVLARHKALRANAASSPKTGTGQLQELHQGIQAQGKALRLAYANNKKR